MVIAVLADNVLKEEFLTKPVPQDTEIIWADSLRSLMIIEADVYFDLLFQFDRNRIQQLQKLLPKAVVINSVVHTSNETHEQFTRINAWPTMLKRNVIEFAGHPFPADLQWQCQQVPDITGMVTPRIVAMIINEAWFTFGEGVSTKAEIDTALRLGTNYPFGPFEWGEQIGLEKIAELLSELKRADERYTISPALLNEINRNAADIKY